jgi:hypothetical protein
VHQNLVTRNHPVHRMSNPFDQFTSELHGALPPAPEPMYQPYQEPVGPPQPIMNTPQQPAYGGGVPAYGMPPQQTQYTYGQPPFGDAPAMPPVPAQSGSEFISQFGAPAAHPPFGAPPQAVLNVPQTLDNPFEVHQHAEMPGAPPPPPPALPPAPPVAAGVFADPWGASQQTYQPDHHPGPFESSPPQSSGAPPETETFGMPPQPHMDPSIGALVPAQHQSNPYAQQGPYGQAPPQQHPYGQQPYGQPEYSQFQAPPPPAPVDPFSVFNTAPAPVFTETAIVPAMQPVAAPVAGDDDFWSSFGGKPRPDADTATDEPEGPREKKNTTPGDLPPGGELYDARIFTPTLGVMFFKPQELTDSLFLNTDRDVVDGLGERPVVAFIVEGSSARSAGVELGHVLLKVNGQAVSSPKEASRLIKEGPRPLPLLFYVPNADVVIAEGEHMVKYDTKETTAPSSAKDWKPKYVVIGGIIAQPWMMNMYRSKSEYDIAVIETQARRPVSVKVKQFSLQGSRIQNDWQGPQMVKYKNKIHPWKYIVVLPVARNPIKISAPNLSQLKPVHEGIRRVLLAQQRGRSGGGPNSAAPVRKDQERSQRSTGGDDSQRSVGGRSYQESRTDSYSQSPTRPPANQVAAQSQPPSLIDNFSQQPSNDYNQPPPSNYSQPPPNNYSQPLPNSYSQPPPPNIYSQPPPNDYNQPPPNSYSHPPPNRYNQPPPNNYSQPPPNNYGPPAGSADPYSGYSQPPPPQPGYTQQQMTTYVQQPQQTAYHY